MREQCIEPTGPYSNKFGKSAPDKHSFNTATTSRCSTTSSTHLGRLEMTNKTKQLMTTSTFLF